jgi:hypothetical protein
VQPQMLMVGIGTDADRLDAHVGGAGLDRDCGLQWGRERSARRSLEDAAEGGVKG